MLAIPAWFLVKPRSFLLPLEEKCASPCFAHLTFLAIGLPVSTFLYFRPVVKGLGLISPLFSQSFPFLAVVPALFKKKRKRKGGQKRGRHSVPFLYPLRGFFLNIFVIRRAGISELRGNSRAISRARPQARERLPFPLSNVHKFSAKNRKSEFPVSASAVFESAADITGQKIVSRARTRTLSHGASLCPKKTAQIWAENYLLKIF